MGLQAFQGEGNECPFLLRSLWWLAAAWLPLGGQSGLARGHTGQGRGLSMDQVIRLDPKPCPWASRARSGHSISTSSSLQSERSLFRHALASLQVQLRLDWVQEGFPDLAATSATPTHSKNPPQ